MTTIPTIHLNGTGFTTLRDEYAAAYDAIDKAIDALAATTANGRDFYPQGADAYYRHRDERQAALDKLREAHQYVGEVLAGICDQRR
jgi:UDP-N-acetylmuramyl pentapeptide synthase